AIPADTYWFPLLYLATGECRLARGELSEARHQGRRLCELTEKAPERTYLAHGHRLLAEIAMAEGALEEADAEIHKALAIVTAAEVPLAAWRGAPPPPPPSAPPRRAARGPRAPGRGHP